VDALLGAVANKQNVGGPDKPGHDTIKMALMGGWRALKRKRPAIRGDGGALQA
jgi:hypothetical protein